MHGRTLKSVSSLLQLSSLVERSSLLELRATTSSLSCLIVAVLCALAASKSTLSCVIEGQMIRACQKLWKTSHTQHLCTRVKTWFCFSWEPFWLRRLALNFSRASSCSPSALACAASLSFFNSLILSSMSDAEDLEAFLRVRSSACCASKSFSFFSISSSFVFSNLSAASCSSVSLLNESDSAVFSSFKRMKTGLAASNLSYFE